MKSREFMAETLRELQPIQVWALDHSIHSFEITAVAWPLEDEGEGEEGLIQEYGDTEERFIYVTIFKTGDDTDEDYFRVTFGPNDSDADYFRSIARIKYFIGMEG